MTQRNRKSSISNNVESVTCEKYLARQLRKEKTDDSKPNQYSQNKYRENMSKQYSYNTTLLNKNNRLVQENVPFNNQKPGGNLPEYSDDGTSKYFTAQERPKSATKEHEPWGKILKSERNTDRSSVFGNFDPLRTLHFLVKELQFQLETVLPNDNALLQIVLNMHQALKRIPPEVASTIHLQQAFHLLPSRNNSRISMEPPEKLKTVSERGTQTLPKDENNEEMQQIMIQNSMKLEASCRQMELLCMNLKIEKENLEKQLKFEKENLIFYKKRIDDLELGNNNLLAEIKTFEKEKEELKLEEERVKISSENQKLSLENSLKSEISDLKNSRALLEKECTKLKHQLKLSTMEKEKYSAILNIRNQQIMEMRNELLQLHEVISYRCLNLQKSAVKTLPKLDPFSKNLPNEEVNKENIGDCSISTIYSYRHQVEKQFTPQQNKYTELPSAELEISDNFSLNFPYEPHRKDIRNGLSQANKN